MGCLVYNWPDEFDADYINFNTPVTVPLIPQLKHLVGDYQVWLDNWSQTSAESTWYVGWCI